MKHKSYIIANTLAITVSLIYVVCAMAIVFFPDLAMTIAQSWFHGLDLAKISTPNVTPGSFILGFITATAGAWLVGYIFTFVYKQFAK